MKKISLILCLALFFSCPLFSQNNFESNLNGKIKSVTILNHYIKPSVNSDSTIIIYKNGIKINGVGYTLSSNGHVHLTEKYFFDSIGKMIEEIDYYIDARKELDSERSVYKYNKEGMKIIKYDYDYDDSLKGSTIYEYNGIGDLKSETEKDLSGFGNPDIITTYKFDDKGKKIEKAPFGGQCCRVTYHYDEKGNLIERDDYKLDGTFLAVKFSYKFDINNNWIEKTENSDTKNATSKRIIEYSN